MKFRSAHKIYLGISSAKWSQIILYFIKIKILYWLDYVNTDLLIVFSGTSMLNLFLLNQNPDFVQISWVITMIFIKVTGIYANHIIRPDEALFKSLDGNPLFSATTGRCNKNIDLWYNLHEIFRRSLTGHIQNKGYSWLIVPIEVKHRHHIPTKIELHFQNKPYLESTLCVFLVLNFHWMLIWTKQ